MKAGLPYRVRPTDALPSPITLQNVRIEVAEPTDISTSTYTLTGTFQATEDVPAFGVIDIQDPNHTSIHSVDAEKTAGNSYDLSGRRATPTTKGVVINNGKKALF